jgi:RNA-directed DNA polymerase
MGLHHPVRKQAEFQRVSHYEIICQNAKGGQQVTANKTAEATSHKEVDWNAIDWRKAHREVRRLQIRIVKATQAKDQRKVEALQRLLAHSFYAKALAVKQVTENKGRNTAGIDGVIWNTAQAKADAIKALQNKKYKPLPLRRILIPKGKGKGKGYRKLGIPAMKDRAMQAL